VQAGLAALDGLPLTVDNEANLAALGELHAGPAGPASFLYVSGEIGIGAGIVLHGALFRGARGWSGELGHVAVRPDGPACRCGAQGCLEQYAGQEAILRAAAVGGTDDLRAGAEAGNPAVLAALASAGTALGVAVAGVVNLLDVEEVVLGGIYAPLAPWLCPAVAAEIHHRVLTDAWSPVDVRSSVLGGDAAVVGAAGSIVRTIRNHPARWLARAVS
jgi:predicted NBD/HSP70 family sugar kinase